MRCLPSAAATHNGYAGYLLETAEHITLKWRRMMANKGTPTEENRRFEATISFAASIT